ncbi:MAG: cell wall hydrolase, partial [Lachnospiraceae bacterium]|nr:cell wall hydrolase [Lachnospiraceae bacterium]
EAEMQAEREARFTLAMAKTSDYVNVRSEASIEAQRVGVLYKDCGGTIVERGEGWTKIQSGSVLGWVSNDFLYLDEEAEAYAEQVCKTYANVDTQALRVRTSPSEDAGIIGLLEVGTDLECVKTDLETPGWVMVLYQGKTGYVSADYVSLSLSINEGETLEEIEERERLAALEKAKLVTTYKSVPADVDDITLLAALIQCEAGNQSYEGKLAVGAVVCNRVRSAAYPNTIREVIYAKGQFGPASSGSLAKALEKGVSDSCRQAAAEALSGATNVGNAMHFRRAGGRDGVIIGDHVFY